MKALFLDAPGSLRFGEFFEQPEDRLRLRVQAVTVCGSDLHYFKEGGIGASVAAAPHILGHEFSAVVDDDRGAAFGLPPGTLVAVDPNEPCGHCEWCMRAEVNLCPNVRFAGSVPVHGAFREAYHAKPEALHRLPPGFDATAAAMLEPLGVAIHAVDLAKIGLGASVAVVGAGAIGLLILQLARLVGAGEIHAVEPLPYRRELALGLGAIGAHASSAGVLEATGGRGVDVVLEATDSPSGPQAACDAARIGGRVVLVGIPDGNLFTLDAASIRRKGLNIKLSRRMGHVYPRAIRLVADGRVDFGPIVTHRFPFERTAEAFALQAGRGDGVVKCSVIVGD